MNKEYNPFSLQGKTILVTGASSGIGKSIAIECSKMKAKLCVIGRDIVRLNETLSELEGEGHRALQFDINENEKIKSFISELPELNGVVHAAGIIKRLPLKFISKEDFNEILDTNLVSASQVTRELHKQKKLKTGSSIVFISSIASDFASIGNIMYMASKGAVNSFSKGIAFEFAKSNIRSNVIQPGMVVTNLTKVINDKEIEEDIKRYPLGRYGTTQEIAYAAIYLLSDASAWVTGSKIVVDGGITLR